MPNGPKRFGTRNEPGRRTPSGSQNPNGTKEGNGIGDFPAAGPALIPRLMKRPRLTLPNAGGPYRYTAQPRVGRQRPSKRQPGKGGRSTY